MGLYLCYFMSFSSVFCVRNESVNEDILMIIRMSSLTLSFPSFLTVLQFTILPLPMAVRNGCRRPIIGDM